MSQLSILSRILVCTWIMTQRLPTRVLKLFIVKEEIVSQLSYFPFFGRPRSSNDDLISSIYIYIYIRTSPGTRDISIVASSACRGNNSAPTHYTGPRVVVDGKPGQNTRSPLLFLPISSLVVPSIILVSTGTDEGESAGIQLSRQNRRGWAALLPVLIRIDDRLAG